jgi:hypothetical protein
MNKDKPPDELKKEMIQKMGPEFGSLFQFLYNEITWMTVKWLQFKELYSKSEDRIKLMNQSAPFFFFTIQKVLWEDSILGIAKIAVDPSKTSGYENANLKALGEIIDDQKTRNDYLNKLKPIEENANKCKQARNKLIAHFDYQASLSQQKEPFFKEISKQEIEDLVEGIHQLYNMVSRKYLGRETVFNLVGHTVDTDKLFFKIEDGIELERIRYKNALEGNNNMNCPEKEK